MLKSKYKQMPPKTITYGSYKNFTEEQFKKAIRSNCSYIEGGNSTSLQHVIKKGRSISSYENDRFMWK